MSELLISKCNYRVDLHCSMSRKIAGQGTHDNKQNQRGYDCKGISRRNIVEHVSNISRHTQGQSDAWNLTRDNQCYPPNDNKLKDTSLAGSQRQTDANLLYLLHDLI